MDIEVAREALYNKVDFFLDYNYEEVVEELYNFELLYEAFIYELRNNTEK